MRNIDRQIISWSIVRFNQTSRNAFLSGNIQNSDIVEYTYTFQFYTELLGIHNHCYLYPQDIFNEEEMI